MAHFLNQTISSAQTIGSSLTAHGAHLGKSLTDSIAAPEQFRVGGHTVTVKQRLAEGGFGLVDHVVELNSNVDYVLKRCSLSKPGSMAVVEKEIKCLQQFKGPYVVGYIASEIINVRGAQEALVLLEYCPGGHLLDKLNERHGQHLSAAIVNRIFGQILTALKPFHDNDPPIVHRDIKLENVLFGTDGKVRLCDFGSCVIGLVPLRTQREREDADEVIQRDTTPMYRAPEMVNLYMRDVLTEKTDIWALGCIYYALCFFIHPFQEAGNLGILSNKINMPVDAAVSEECRELIHRMLDTDPECRPSIEQLLVYAAAVARGEPLPAHELSAEALARREERLEAAKVKAQKKDVKKYSWITPVPPRPETSTALSSNSVAARRLAAKRGGQSGMSPQQMNTTTSSNASMSSFEAHFEEHSPASSSVMFSDNANIQTGSSSFDPFGVEDVARNDQFNDNWVIKSGPQLTSADSLFDTEETEEDHHAFDATPAAVQTRASASFDSSDYKLPEPSPRASFRSSVSEDFHASHGGERSSRSDFGNFENSASSTSVSDHPPFDSFDDAPTSHFSSSSSQVASKPADFFFDSTPSGTAVTVPVAPTHNADFFAASSTAAPKPLPGSEFEVIGLPPQQQPSSSSIWSDELLVPAKIEPKSEPPAVRPTQPAPKMPEIDVFSIAFDSIQRPSGNIPGYGVPVGRGQVASMAMGSSGWGGGTIGAPSPQGLRGMPMNPSYPTAGGYPSVGGYPAYGQQQQQQQPQRGQLSQPNTLYGSGAGYSMQSATTRGISGPASNQKPADPFSALNMLPNKR